MLRLSKTYFSNSILSLQTGGQIGQAIEPIINPNNLRIEGWYSQNYGEKGEFILPSSHVRDFIAKGIVVDNHDALTLPADMVRLQSVIDTRFQLIGKLVQTESGKKLGKIIDFAVADESFYIQKLYVTPRFLRGLTNEQLLIDRNAIIEITDKKIIVADQSVRANSKSPVLADA